jgi:hypothetical protein
MIEASDPRIEDFGDTRYWHEIHGVSIPVPRTIREVVEEKQVSP